MTVDNKKIQAVLTALNDKFENKVSNKKSDISGDFSDDNISYPTVNAVKTELNKKVDKVTGKQLSTEDFTTAEKNKLANLENSTVDTSLSTTSQNAIANFAVTTELNKKANSSDLKTVATTGSYNDLEDKPSLADLEGVVTVEKQATADSGFSASYVVKQNGTQVGAKINIPKDYLVKTASLETVGATPSALESENSLAKGSKYLKFVVNTTDNDGTETTLVIPVDDLIDVYEADNTTITLNNGVFSVKDNGITLAKLAASVQTSLGYADNWNSSPAKGITAQNITDWNNKSEITTADIDNEINAVLDAFANGLSS